MKTQSEIRATTQIFACIYKAPKIRLKFSRVFAKLIMLLAALNGTKARAQEVEQKESNFEIGSTDKIFTLDCWVEQVLMVTARSFLTMQFTRFSLT